MKNRLHIVLVIVFIVSLSCQKELTSDDVLTHAISYHDPNNNWSTFNATFNVVMETPDSPNRDSKLTINLPDEHFYVKAIRDTLVTEFNIKQDNCTITFNGKTTFTQEEATANRLDCDTAKRYRDYYTYLYGLPMKLKDPGTNIHETVERKTFKGKDYLVLKATYDEGVGSDIWYFYFDPETYAMEVYQFFKTDEDGQMKLDSGEYILLTEEAVINDIKMPKVRAWYYNKDDTYLGTDNLVQ